jgi:hypothetical protein
MMYHCNMRSVAGGRHRQTFGARTLPPVRYSLASTKADEFSGYFLYGVIQHCSGGAALLDRAMRKIVERTRKELHPRPLDPSRMECVLGVVPGWAISTPPVNLERLNGSVRVGRTYCRVPRRSVEMVRQGA